MKQADIQTDLQEGAGWMMIAPAGFVIPAFYDVTPVSRRYVGNSTSLKIRLLFLSSEKSK
jgi:hypothetical protein